MTRNANANKGKAALVTLLALGGCVLWVMLAGGILLALLGGNINDATPLTFLQYAIHAGAQPVRDKLLLSGGMAFAVLALPVAVIVLYRKKPPLHGAARFATRREVAKAGLLGDDGLIVGKLGNSYLLFGGQQHVLLSAPTRSGKGVGVVIPNLLAWPHSVVVLDIKLENWAITSGYRKSCGHACYLFNPAPGDGKAAKGNGAA
jgi:type IV secretion system protein VirD4